MFALDKLLSVILLTALLTACGLEVWEAALLDQKRVIETRIAFTQAGCEKHGIAMQNTMPLAAGGYTSWRCVLIAYYGW